MEDQIIDDDIILHCQVGHHVMLIQGDAQTIQSASACVQVISINVCCSRSRQMGWTQMQYYRAVCVERAHVQ